MKDSEIVTIGHLKFRKDCAKGTTLEQFRKSYSNQAFDSLDKDKAYVILGGEVKKKKSEKKESPEK